ncbi:hypothetical protein GCM10027294_05450 [Marinactinospora endophytica]
MTVRDPAEAIGRLNRWNSGTDGESPDGRQRAWETGFPSSSTATGTRSPGGPPLTHIPGA